MNPLDQPITFTIGKDHIIDIGDGKVRVEIGLTLREFLDVCGIKNMNPQPSYINVIAQGGGYTVMEYNGIYLVKGLVAGITVAFNNRDEWNLMMAVLKIADAQINGVDE